MITWSYRSIAYRTPTRSFSRALQVGTVEERRVAARELYNSVHGEIEIAIPALIRAAHDEDSMVRAEAVESLGLLAAEAIRKAPRADPSTRTPLDFADRSAQATAVSAADDPDPRVREKAMRALMFLFYARQGLGTRGSVVPGPPPEVEPGPFLTRILAALGDPDPAVRDAAARTIAFFPGHLDPALPILIRIVNADAPARASPSAPMAGPRVALLAARPSPSAVPDLIRALPGPGPARPAPRRDPARADRNPGRRGGPGAGQRPGVASGDPAPAATRPRPPPAPLPAVARGTPEMGRAVSALAAMLRLGPARPEDGRRAGPGRVRLRRLDGRPPARLDPRGRDPPIRPRRTAGRRGARPGPPPADPVDSAVEVLIRATGAADDQIVYRALTALTALGPRASAALPRLRELARPEPARPWRPWPPARPSDPSGRRPRRPDRRDDELSDAGSSTDRPLMVHERWLIGKHATKECDISWPVNHHPSLCINHPRTCLVSARRAEPLTPGPPRPGGPRPGGP